MASPAQITANRANAQHSTGPRSQQGKAKSAANRMSHGLSSREFVILPGQELEFESFMDDLRLSIQPHGGLETDLFSQLAHAAWTLRRCRRAEADLQSASLDPHLDPLLAPELQARLRTIDLYSRRAERSYHKTLKELKTLQTNREYALELQFAVGVPAEGQPAPLTQNLSLDIIRRKNVAVASNRGIARTQLKIQAAAAELSAAAASRIFPEHSNPIPAPEAAAAAR
jgi:hypothetical protein